ncbi:MAG: hypothetical protein JRN21_08715 [Nitrososphaerota archaeon]|nr:hypothetical protein [Nitrososphaerota archaeon]
MTNLSENKSLLLMPRPPYNFGANFHKPSHFPSSNTTWEEGRCWATMLWKGEAPGLKFRNEGTTSRPSARLAVFSRDSLNQEYFDELVAEVRWMFNFD